MLPLTNFDVPVSYEISEFRPSLSARTIYCRNLDLCLWLADDVRFSGEQDFSFSTNTGGAGYNKFRQVVCVRISFSMCSNVARMGTFRKQNWESKVQVNTKVSGILFVSANTHQGGECFSCSIESRGKQSAFMSLSASLATECIPLKEWSQSTRQQ